MSILPGNKAPWFSSIGFMENKFLDISINDYSDKWLILFFYPLDFGYVSPSELLELEKRRPQLESLNCRVLAVSQDSVVVHERFANLNPGYGGVFDINFPLMEDKGGNISRLYGVDKAQAGHSYRAYFIIDPSQTVRARVVGDLPVALGLDEMMRQVVALQMVVKDNALVDGKGNKIADSPSTPAAVADNFSKSFLTNNVTFYNKQIIGVVGGAAQSPVDLRGAQQDEDLGQLSFNYTPIWAADPDPWSPGALSGTVVSPQPSLVKNTGLTWEMEVARHHQMILTHGPLHEKDYRLALVNAHWGGSEHSLEGKFFDGELHLIHHHLQYSDVKEASRHLEGITVVAIFLTIDDENANTELEKIGEVLPRIEVKGEEAQTAEVVDVKGLLPQKRDYLTYQGSLTTPDFSEGVTWIVLTNPISVSSATLTRMQQLRYGGASSPKMVNNCRNPAALGSRSVWRPKTSDV